MDICFKLGFWSFAVTTTNQAIKALEMLRENRDKYDLVISDVNMPDMDGFQLLELVGLEMDLPVISKHELSLENVYDFFSIVRIGFDCKSGKFLI